MIRQLNVLLVPLQAEASNVSSESHESVYASLACREDCLSNWNMPSGFAGLNVSFQ